MDGFYLYKHYTGCGKLARRGTSDWQYGQLLTEAFYLVGITKLFDMLEQAEQVGKRIELVYSAYSETGIPMPSDIQLIDT